MSTDELMKLPLRRVTSLVCVLLAAGIVLLLMPKAPPAKRADSTPSTDSIAAGPSPPPTQLAALVETETRGDKPSEAPGRRGPQLKIRASDLTEAEKADFENKFVEKIKPAVERWCEIYEGHVPFQLGDVTPDKLRERFGQDPSFYDYGFVIHGTTLSVVDDKGDFFVAYLMSPAAALLFQIPERPEPPKPVSVTREEVLKLLKADSGEDFPSTQIAMRPTAYGGAMNGGLSVDVGEGVNGDYPPFPRYSMVFGPDGNLACYLRRIVK
jgi:hypothetical protein